MVNSVILGRAQVHLLSESAIDKYIFLGGEKLSRSKQKYPVLLVNMKPLFEHHLSDTSRISNCKINQMSL